MMNPSHSTSGYRLPMSKPANIAIPPNNMTDCRIATPAPSQHNGINSHQISGIPAIVHRLAKLHDIMAPRPPNASNVRVLAVGGLNPCTVEALLEMLRLYIQSQSPEIIVQLCLKMSLEEPFSSGRSRDRWNAFMNSFFHDPDHQHRRRIVIVDFVSE